MKSVFFGNDLKNICCSRLKIGRMIIAWVSKHLDQCDNPRLFGKGLSDDKKGLWRYRIGDYRLLCHLMDDRLIILVVDVGHRKEIYK
jgi:mRNA interferase RelE/StbE